MIILALETSCDETAVALTENGRCLASKVSSQTKIHAPYGGVVPELSARQHLEVILSSVQKTLEEAKTNPEQIDAVAFTVGPGLLPSLLIGVDTAKTLAYAWKKPLIAVNHLEGHLYSAFFEFQGKRKIFPLLGLLVSGGHTEIVLMKNHGNYQLLGETLDDAAGEAFDKVASLLNLPYPGGPEISKIAHLGNSKTFQFTRPLLSRPDFNFSFSGLKTDVLRLIKRKKYKLSLQEKRNVAASFQKAVVDVLLFKFLAAANKIRPRTLILTGGVAANSLLRRTFQKEFKRGFPKARVIIPPFKLCTDNAVMIALAAEEKFKRKEFANFNVTAEPNLRLS